MAACICSLAFLEVSCTVITSDGLQGIVQKKLILSFFFGGGGSLHDINPHKNSIISRYHLIHVEDKPLKVYCSDA